MSACAQAGPKRQKMRDQRIDCVDYFQGVDQIEFKQIGGTSDALCYNDYNRPERLHGRTIEDWLKLSISFTAFKYNGSDSYGKPTYQRSWQDDTYTLENCKRCIKACYDFCQKLGIKYWTAFDTDIIPRSDDFNDYKVKWDEMSDFILELTQRTHVKPLWIAPDLHSHQRYATGAATNNNVDIFMQAAAQTKKCLEMAHRLNTECFLFWPYREGYDNPFRCDIRRELKLLAKLFKMAADYKERLSYRGQLLILPYYENMEYRSYMSSQDFKSDSLSKKYMWDAMSCMYFLRHYNLENYYKVCAAPGHQLHLISMYDGLGGVVIIGDEDFKILVMTMKAIIDQGSAVIGGINMTVRARRDSADERDLTATYVRRVDAAARALRVATSLVADQTFSKHLQQKYSSYGGTRFAADLALPDCEEHLKKNKIHNNDMFTSSQSEYWDLVFQRYLDGCTQV